MSFKGFADTDINELRKNLKKRSELAADFKEQIDNQQGISNYVKEITIKQAKPIVDAIKKEQDERAKSTTGARSEADEIRVLNSNPITIMEYFRTLRPDIFKDNTESEISIMSLPMKLMKSEVEIKTDGKRTILVIKGKAGNPDEEKPLDIAQTWLLLFNAKTLEKYGLLNKLIDLDYQTYFDDILYAANDKKSATNIPKFKEIQALLKQKSKTGPQYPIWEDPNILNMTFMELVKYITDREKSKDPIIDEILKNNQKVKNNQFRFNLTGARELVIGEDAKKKGKSTRKGTIRLDNTALYRKPTVTVSFVDRQNPPDVVLSEFTLSNPRTKFSLLIPGDQMLDIAKKLFNSTGDNLLFEQIYEETPTDTPEIRKDIKQITDWVTEKNIGPDGTAKTGLGIKVAKPKAARSLKAAKPKGRKKDSVKYTQENPELSGYGVLRDPFKDAKTVKKTKGSVVHRSYNIVDGKFGNVDIDVPKLYTRLHLTAKKGGTLIFDEPVDKDTVDLLTTHPRRKRVYSKQSIKTLAKLMELSDQPIKTNSRKLQMVQKYHNKKRASVPMNEEDVSLDRLTTLLLEHQAGNYPNAQLQNEIAHQADTLLRHGLITDKMHKQIYSKYVVG